MNDLEKLEQLIADGYWVLGNPRQIGKITSNTRVVFSLKLSAGTLSDPLNIGKSLIILRHPRTNDQVEMLTGDDRAIERANKQWDYEMEPVGLLVAATCVAPGDAMPHRKEFVLDKFIASLNGLWGWKFAALKNAPGAFQVTIRLDTVDKNQARQCLDRLEDLLDCLAVCLNVGFYIQASSVNDVPRIIPGPWYPVGVVLRILRPAERWKIENILSLFSYPPARMAARGLNQAYIENYLPNRLSMLWAAVEQIFGSKPEALLSKDEVTCLLDHARNIPTLAADSERLKQLETALTDPNRLPRVGRNARIAEAISTILEIKKDEAYEKVRKASVLRGKNAHQLSDNWNDIQTSIQFLEEALSYFFAGPKGD